MVHVVSKHGVGNQKTLLNKNEQECSNSWYIQHLPTENWRRMGVLIQQITSELLSSATPYIIMFVFGVLVGSLAPTYYAGERMRGFGRAMFQKLPYKPPPGRDAEEALIEATDYESGNSVEEPEKKE